jgi:photosystem II stability/assembly factor-like uncharacterized protein
MTGYVVSYDKVYKTTNGGDNWFIQTTGLVFQPFCIKFANDNIGFICGGYVDGNSLLYKTTNAGNNWIQLNPGTNYQLNSLAIISADTVFIGGYFGTILKTTNGGGTIGILRNETTIPSKYYLYQNYPNPFNAGTKIKFEIPNGFPIKTFGNVKQVVLTMYDITGREIQTLVNKELQPGIYEVTFDGTNLPSGIYFYQLKTGEFIETKKLILLK